MQRLLMACLFSLSLIGTSFAQDEKVRVVMETNMGKATIELNPEKAPITVKNFLEYVDKKHYDGTIFHRVIADFMIQGGGFESGMKPKETSKPIKNESSNGLSNERGTIAMARTDEPNSATAQFYINVVDNKFLDRANAKDKVGYCVFGKVVEGMDMVDKIRRVEVEGSAPTKDVVIRSIRRVK
jgi:cyclophilin family peptidyl-prolyl cis-trans isomerase